MHQGDLRQSRMRAWVARRSIAVAPDDARTTVPFRSITLGRAALCHLPVRIHGQRIANENRRASERVCRADTRALRLEHPPQGRGRSAEHGSFHQGND